MQQPTNVSPTGNHAGPDHQAIDLPRLQNWLSEHLVDFQGPLTLQKFAGGQSNPTYQLITPRQSYVMRSKPGPVSRLLPSAHAIEREFRVMSALASTQVPVAKMLVLCEDESVIGRAFYIMEFVSGRVFWDQSLPELTPVQRREVYLAMNSTLAALHTVDPASIGLADYGKPGNYFERQISRWSKQYQASVTDPIPEMDKLMAWLPTHIPASARNDSINAIVHGDFRLDNLMFSPTEPSVRAVLDWELSTLGHPLADFSYHCMSWHIQPGVFRGIQGLDLPSLGIPSEDEYIALYCAKTGFITPEQLQPDWPFYLAYNMFRLAAILQGIAKRVQAGTASSAKAIESAAGARPLAQSAWRMVQAS